MSEELDAIPAPTHSHRFFRTSTEVYEGARAYMDSVFGHPKPGTTTCISPVAEAPKDDEGRVYVALAHAQCSWPEVAPVLEDLLAAQQVEEVEEADWPAATSSEEGGE